MSVRPAARRGRVSAGKPRRGPTQKPSLGLHGTLGLGARGMLGVGGALGVGGEECRIEWRGPESGERA